MPKSKSTKKTRPRVPETLVLAILDPALFPNLRAVREFCSCDIDTGIDTILCAAQAALRAGAPAIHQDVPAGVLESARRGAWWALRDARTLLEAASAGHEITAERDVLYDAEQRQRERWDLQMVATRVAALDGLDLGPEHKVLKHFLRDGATREAA